MATGLFSAFSWLPLTTTFHVRATQRGDSDLFNVEILTGLHVCFSQRNLLESLWMFGTVNCYLLRFISLEINSESKRRFTDNSCQNHNVDNTFGNCKCHF